MATKTFSAFAPASVGNVAVGFDILGLSFPVLGDRVTIEGANFDSSSYSLKIKEIIPENDTLLQAPASHRGHGSDSISMVAKIVEKDLTKLPHEVSKNTVTVAIESFLKDQKLGGDFEVTIAKGIPLSSGLGGSASSAVAGVVAINQFLEKPLEFEELVDYAIDGEFVASGSRHGDNVFPSLFGGIQLIVSESPLARVSLPLPEVYVTVVHPDIKINTIEARQLLRRKIELKEHSGQAGYLGGFVAACFENNLDLIGTCLKDILIEPQRSTLLPNFSELKEKVLSCGALGFSISGAGPTVFSMSRNEEEALKIAAAVEKHFESESISSQSWISKLFSDGAKVC